MPERVLLRGSATPSNEIRIVDVIEEQSDAIVVEGRGLPGDREELTVRPDAGWSVRDVPDDLAGLDSGQYVICRGDGDELVVRETTDLSIWASIVDAPIVHRCSETSLLEGSS